ncbi:P35 family lipoprotein [Malacoplasma iowae]|uniref:p35 lipoprotein family protein n=1 Tax=Malacoplasma iowae DK-CPA TaxID=1394179 RepID=A0A084U389_MALIO|nr:P35 family lipoprotein [Malacoplasma iowae]KFB07425.1 P35 lipoprotein family protein [Malacoplasma iowae DK-CPA]WPL36948.1 P35 family lipoprotein [Malacoplasma iowae]WPL38140.1 P35 family lipoprotein [Malacoplasma iowae]WPL41407.1 P35 family lipoprotein [Malacoplasma iowae]
MDKKKKNKLKKILISIGAISLIAAIPTAIVLSTKKPISVTKDNPNKDIPTNENEKTDEDKNNSSSPNDSVGDNNTSNDNNNSSSNNDENQSNESNKDDAKLNININKNLNILEFTESILKNKDNQKNTLETIINKHKQLLSTQEEIKTTSIKLVSDVDLIKDKKLKELDLKTNKVTYYNNEIIFNISNLDELFVKLTDKSLLNTLFNNKEKSIQYEIKDNNNYFVDNDYIYILFNKKLTNKTESTYLAIPLANIELNLKDFEINLTKDDKTQSSKLDLTLRSLLKFNDINSNKLFLVDYDFKDKNFKMEVLRQMGYVQDVNNKKTINYSKIIDDLKLHNTEIKNIDIKTSSGKMPGTKDFDSKYDLVFTVQPKENFFWENNSKEAKQIKMKNINILLKAATWENVSKYYYSNIKMWMTYVTTEEDFQSYFRSIYTISILRGKVYNLMKDDLKKWNMDIEFVKVISDPWRMSKAEVRLKLVPLPGYTYEFGKYENEAYFNLQFNLLYE